VQGTSGTAQNDLEQRRMMARLSALFKAYTGEPAWRAIGDRLQRPYYLSWDDHNHKIRTRKQKMMLGSILLQIGLSGTGISYLRSYWPPTSVI
jgi:hypothetical protein